MADEQDLWVVHSGTKTVKSGENKKAALLISTMDEMAVAGQGPIILDTEDDKVLKKAAEYAAQKGYPLVSSTPEQNLKIAEFQRPIFGEDIADGAFGPSAIHLKKESPDKYHDYNTIIDKTLDKLPEGFETVIEVQASVVRDGVLMNTIGKLPEDKFNHWEAVRLIRQTDLSQPAISDGNPPQVIVERHPFSEAEQAANQAMDMRKEPVTVERLKNVIDPELDTENAEHPRNALLKKLIAEREKTVEVDKTAKMDDPLADINAIVAQNKKQKNPFDDEMDKKKSLGIQPVAFPEIHPPAKLTHRFGVATSMDYGNRLVVTRMGMMAITPPQFRKRDELIADTLLKARERFGEPVRVTGNKGFEQAAIKAAIAQGIPLEMASDRGVEAYQLALNNEKKRLLTKEMGRMEPSMKKERGVSRGLAR